MAGRINSDDIDELKRRLDIVEVIRPYTELKQSGTSYMGRCPFHDEKTGSFSVSKSRGFYHCFGCNAGGDGIKFIQEVEGLSFTEAIERLAKQFGVTLRYEELKPGQKKALGRRTRLMEVLVDAQTFFVDQLHSPAGADARKYLIDRGVDEGAWKIFGLGWAPDSWAALSDHLLAAGAKPNELTSAGISTQGRKGLIDRFRARVTFPIVASRGSEPVAFGGRILPDGPVTTKMDGRTPKYINSPATEVYDKSKVLYGLNIARSHIVKAREAIVVEGYMDVIGLHLVGTKNVVAPCGTALTTEHFQLLQRLDAKVTLCLDADTAGFDAAERARERAVAAEIDDLGVLVLPDGTDPADLATQGGPEAVEAALAQRKTALEFQIDHLLRSVDLSTPEAKTVAYRSTFELLGKLDDPALRYHYVFNVVAPAVGLPAQRIEDELSSVYPIRRTATSQRSQPRRTVTPIGTRSPQLQLEREILQIAMQVPESLPEEWATLDPVVFTAEPSQVLYRALVTYGEDLDAVLDAMPDDSMRARVRGLVVAELTADSSPHHVKRMIDTLRAFDVDRRLAQARQALKDATSATDKADALATFTELNQQKRSLSGPDYHSDIEF